MSDPAKYRTKDELQQYKQQDPILILKDALIRDKVINEDQYKKLDTEMKAICSNAVQFAEESPEPALSELHTDVYV